jgi:hypothetical protein
LIRSKIILLTLASCIQINMSNKFHLLLLLFITNLLYSQNPQSLWTRFAKDAIAKFGVAIYHDSLGMSPPTSLLNSASTADFQQELNKFLLKDNMAILVYNESQWIITPADLATATIADLKSRENLLQKSASSDYKVIGKIENLRKGSTATISGKIIDPKTNLAIIGAEISVDNGSIGTVTDANGMYTIEVPKGEHAITITAEGFEQHYEDMIIYDAGTYEVELNEKSISLDEIIVSEKAKDKNVREVLTGVQELSIKEIKKLPSFMGEVDVMKSLLTLPGVSSTGEGVGGIIVRGGNTSQNLIYQDDIVYYNPSHALGFFSLFHPDLTEEAKLYKGSMPSKFGGRISSVLQTNTVNGNKEKWALKGGLGLTSSRIALNGPIIKDKLTLVLGGRLSTINWLLGEVDVPEVQNSKVDFYDLQTKINYFFSPTTSIGMQYYSSNDDVKLGNQAKFDYQTTGASAYFKKTIGGNKFLTLKYTQGDYKSALNDLLRVNSTEFKTGVNYQTLKADLVVDDNKNSPLNVGIELIKYKVNPGAKGPGAENSEVLNKILPIDNALELALFVDKKINVSSKLSLQSGLRLSGFANVGEKILRYYGTKDYFEKGTSTSSSKLASGKMGNTTYGIEPRFSANYDLGNAASIKGSYNRTYQYIAQISNTTAATPIDFWQLSDQNLKPQHANTVSVGIFKNFKNNEWETSLELYHSDITNVVEYRDFADLLANEEVETSLLLGKGKNYGAELSLKKSIGKFTTRLAYTLSRSLRKMDIKDDPTLSINDGAWYRSNFDKPHDFNLLMNINPSQRISFNFNFNFSTGRPITAPYGKFDDWNLLGSPIFSSRNNYRIPDYHRLDISMNIFPGYRKDKKWKSSWTLGVYNVYARKNAYSVYFRQQGVGSLSTYKLSVLGSIFPSITYNFQI